MPTEKDLEQLPDKVNEEVGQQEEPNDVERVATQVEQADESASAVVAKADDLISQVLRDEQSGEAVDAAETVAALQQVKRDAVSLRSEFTRRLYAILGAIGDKVRAMQERRLTQQLAVPDNPKIIKRLVRDLKRTDVPLEPSLDLFARAEKYYTSRWNEITSLIDQRIVATVPIYVDEGRIDAALRLYDAASRDVRYSTLDTVIARGVANAFDVITPADEQFSAEAYLARREQFTQLDETSRKLLGNRSELAYTYRQLLPEVQGKVFSDSERGLLSQPIEVVRPLANFPADQQIAIVDSWVTHPRMDWPDIMRDEHASKIVDVLMAFPNVDRYSSQYDRTAILQIAEKFSPSQQAMAWEKAGSPQCSWDDAHAYMVVGNLPDSTPEQIRSLDAQQWKYVTLAMLAYGDKKVAELWTQDNLLDLKEVSERSRGGYYSQLTPEVYFEFAKSLSPVLREHLPKERGSGYGTKSASRPDHTVWEHGGFHGIPKVIRDFQSVLALVPRAYRDELFSVLAPTRYMSWIDDRRYTQLTTTQAKNCIEYITTTQRAGELELTSLLNVAEYFTDERWPGIQAGIAKCQTEELIMPANGSHPEVELLVYERVGNPDQTDVNTQCNVLWKACQDRSPTYVGQKSRYNEEIEANERTASSIFALQIFTEACNEYFVGQPEHVAEYMNLDATKRQVIMAWLDGTVLAHANGAVDLPLIEGTMISLGRHFNEIKEQERNDLREFTRLSPDQQQRWLYLRKNIVPLGGIIKHPDNTSQLFALAVSEEGQQIQEFIQAHNLGNFTAEAITTMVQRPDCLGLFYYVDSTTIPVDQQKALIDRLIALRDAGFPDSLMLTQPDAAAKLSNTYGTYGDRKPTYELFMQWDSARLAQVAQYAVQHHPDLTFLQLFQLNPEDPIQRSMHSINYAAAERSSYLKTYFEHHHQEGSQAEIDLMNARREQTESIIDLECEQSHIEKLRRLSEAAWNKLITLPKALEQYLQGKKYSIPEAALDLPDAILEDPRIWKYDLPDMLWIDAEKMQSAIYIIERLTEAGISYTEYGTPWEHWVEAWQQAPWLFTAENLRIVKQTDTRLGIAQFATCTEAEWQGIKESLTDYRFEYASGISEFVERAPLGELPLTDEQMQEIHQYVDRIDWTDAQQMARRIAEGETLAEIITEKDVSEDYHDRTWQNQRREFLSSQVRSDLPTFGTGEHATIADWKIIAGLPQTALHNLEQLRTNDRYLGDHPEVVANLIVIAEHPNAKLLIQLFSIGDGIHTSIINLPTEQIVSFCDRISPPVIERLRDWPDNLEIYAKDSIDFFADPKSETIVEFSQELRNVFGEDFRMSVYDLLIMNVDTDLANLQQLRQESVLPITSEHLERLAVVTTGEMQQTVTKLLAMFNHSYKIDLTDSVQQLNELNPDLRAAVMLAKGPGNFGWSIIHHQQLLIDRMGITEEQFAKLICGAYTSDPNHIPQLDATAAKALLENARVNMDSKHKVMADVLSHFTGTLEEIKQELYVNTTALATLAKEQWGVLPGYVIEDKQFWEILVNEDPTIYIDHYESHIEGVVLTSSAVDTLIINGDTKHLTAVIDYAHRGEIELTFEQQTKTAVAYLGKGGDISIWLGDERKHTLLEAVLAQVAVGWKTEHVEQQAVLDILQTAGIITDTTLRTPHKVSPYVEAKLYASMLCQPDAGIASINAEVGKLLGEQALQIQAKQPEAFITLNRAMVANEFARLKKSMNESDELSVTTDNWLSVIMAFARTTIEDHELPALDAQLGEKVKAAFKNSEPKAICYKELEKQWLAYLRAGRADQSSAELVVVTGFINDCDGAGPLSQVEALSLFVNNFQRAVNAITTAEQTRNEIMNGARTMEERFARERWSNEDKADYYNISKDMLNADPSLFADIQTKFKQFSPAELKRFIGEVYPLFRAQLAVLDQPYKPEDLVEVREMLRNTDDMSTLKGRLVEDLTNRFKTRFGIKMIPEQFTAEHVRTLTNSTMYLANMASRTAQKEHILGWHLALSLNNMWSAYRRGEAIDPQEYLEGQGVTTIAKLVEDRQRLSPLTAEQLGIAESDLPEFQALLQTEVPNISIGDVETIDTKLGNVIINLRTLEDPDLYPDAMDKERMRLLVEFGHKKIGAVAAKLYLSAASPERGARFTEDEIPIRDAMTSVLEKSGLELTPDNVKHHLQTAMKPLATIANVVRLVEDTNAEAEITALREVISPTDDIVSIFRRLGEEFETHSGALALTQDLDYLDTLIVKRQDELSETERELLQGHVAAIRAQVIVLQGIYDQIKGKFGNLRGASERTVNTLLRDKLDSIDRIINAQSVQQAVTTTMTHELNSIIENIRECLSCTKQGCNNDTDLTFGDSNKFFMYSHTESQRKGSVADQIVFLEPITREGGAVEMSFVLDRVYGTCTPFILTNHIQTVVKKYRVLKERFPDATISVFVTAAAISTGGVSADQLTSRLHTILGAGASIEYSEANVDIVGSAAGDHYVEFGGSPRTSGQRAVSGLHITV